MLIYNNVDLLLFRERGMVRFMVCIPNIPVISWSVLMVEETGGPG